MGKPVKYLQLVFLEIVVVEKRLWTAYLIKKKIR